MASDEKREKQHVKIDLNRIAHVSLDLLNEVGLDGLTMRTVATRLEVKAPALYWHVKGKQELLDRMAEGMVVEAVEGLEAPRRDESWEDWVLAATHRLRAAMRRYRDGARVMAGTAIAHPEMFRTTELALRTMVDAGFTPEEAARGFPILLHYTVGYTIEEQAREGESYGECDNPYTNGSITVDAERFPLSAALITGLFTDEREEAFDFGARVIIGGLRALVKERPPVKEKEGA